MDTRLVVNFPFVSARETRMDRGGILLGALRARGALSGALELSATEVESLGDAGGITATELPTLIAQLQRRTPPAVELVWGGRLRLSARNEAAGGGGTTFNLQGAQLGDNPTFAGRDAVVGSTIGSDSSQAIGALAAVIVQLTALRPTLQGDAAAAAARTEQLLRTRPEPNAPSATRTSWIKGVRDSLSVLLQAAPNAKALVELSGEALKLLN
jgi:hypothetical protein